MLILDCKMLAAAELLLSSTSVRVESGIRLHPLLRQRPIYLLYFPAFYINGKDGSGFQTSPLHLSKPQGVQMWHFGASPSLINRDSCMKIGTVGPILQVGELLS